MARAKGTAADDDAGNVLREKQRAAFSVEVEGGHGRQHLHRAAFAGKRVRAGEGHGGRPGNGRSQQQAVPGMECERDAEGSGIIDGNGAGTASQRSVGGKQTSAKVGAGKTFRRNGRWLLRLQDRTEQKKNGKGESEHCSRLDAVPGSSRMTLDPCPLRTTVVREA